MELAPCKFFSSAFTKHDLRLSWRKTLGSRSLILFTWIATTNQSAFLENSSYATLNIVYNINSGSVTKYFCFQMLNCILGMVDKTKRALTILQQRNSVNVNQINSAGNFGSGLTSGLASCGSGNFDDPLTRRTMEMMVEVRRRAEEAVSEVQNISLKLNFTLMFGLNLSVWTC